MATKAKTTTRTGEPAGFTADEKAAMRARAKEQKAQATRAEGEAAARDAIAAMPASDRAMGEQIHAIIAEHAPDLAPRTWYGMPGYATQEGKIVCFFRSAQKFNERYATLGFNDSARLDDGTMWPTSYALTELTAEDEKQVAALVKKAVAARD
jgi:uncharacterized protein YdhG (YjbR/CyaY superfamily)